MIIINNNNKKIKKTKTNSNTETGRGKSKKQTLCDSEVQLAAEIALTAPMAMKEVASLLLRGEAKNVVVLNWGWDFCLKWHPR